MNARIFLLLLVFAACNTPNPPAALVIQTDFGVKDGAVSAMKGVAHGIDPALQVYDLTHEIPAYDIWEGAYRLSQTVPYWPAGTVFVSVVDPGVGTERRSVVARTRAGHYIVTPDNGTLTLLAQDPGIEAVRTIDESVNRRKESGRSYTFHGRDVYVFTAAKLAAGKIDFEEVGPLVGSKVVEIPYQRATNSGGLIKGNIPVLDPQYGNVWTNIPDSLAGTLNIKAGDSLDVRIYFRDSLRFGRRIVFANTFGEVAEGKPLAYYNSLMNFSLALNMGSFADSFHIRTGPDWRIEVSK